VSRHCDEDAALGTLYVQLAGPKVDIAPERRKLAGTQAMAVAPSRRISAVSHAPNDTIVHGSLARGA
jgi:hypothetical protein